MKPFDTRFCPVCKTQFQELIHAGGSTAYCGFGPCDNQTANDGAEGKTYEAACETIYKKIEDEISK